MTAYDQTFFESVNDAGSGSAEVVVPLVVQMLKPSPVVDVGCGTGIKSVRGLFTNAQGKDI